MISKLWMTFLLVIFFVIAGPKLGLAFDPNNLLRTSPPYVHASLLSEYHTLRPGQNHWVMLHLEITPSWHVYWVNPGDSGLAPTIIWTLPEGIRAESLVFPIPERIPIDRLMAFGYTDSVRLLIPLSIDADISVTQAMLKAQVEWLVCKDICLPERTDLVMSLPITHDSPQIISAHISEFTQARRLLPHPISWPARYHVTHDTLSLSVDTDSLIDQTIIDIFFFPYDSQIIDHSAEQHVTYNEHTIAIDMQRDKTTSHQVSNLDGVFVVTTQSILGQRHEGFILKPEYEIPLDIALVVTGQDDQTIIDHEGIGATQRSVAQTTSLSLSMVLFLGLLGGLLLNVMPCVFPILSLKALSFIQSAYQERWQTRVDGMVYTAGILTTFGVIAGLLIGLKSIGSAVGWGFQLQSPEVVFVLAMMFFTIGLLFSGVFSIGNSLVGIGSTLVTHDRDDRAGRLLKTFFTGVLAVVVASPCTVPFMGTAIGFALAQPLILGLLVFFALGLGMALPYLVLSFVPSLTRILPAPGPWMERLKQFLAFPMYATAAWLIWLLAQQNGARGVAMAFAGLLVIAFAAWLFEIMRNTRQYRHGMSVIVIIVSLIGVVVLARENANTRGLSTSSIASSTIVYEPYSDAYLTSVLANGRPVFINFTAAWCITCLVNEQVVLESESVSQAMIEKGIVFLKADLTSYNEEATLALERFGHEGIPLYVLYRPDATLLVLPQLLSQDAIQTALETF